MDGDSPWGDGVSKAREIYDKKMLEEIDSAFLCPFNLLFFFSFLFFPPSYINSPFREENLSLCLPIFSHLTIDAELQISVFYHWDMSLMLGRYRNWN